MNLYAQAVAAERAAKIARDQADHAAGVEALRQQLAAAEAKIEGLNGRFAKDQDRIACQAERIAELERELAEAKTDAADFRGQVNRLTEWNNNLASHRDELIDDLDAARNSLLREGMQRDELLAKVSAWEEKAANWMASPEAAKRLDGYRDIAQRLNVAEQQRDDLLAAPEAVVERWDSPLWKNLPATAEYINRLRSAIGRVNGVMK